MSMSLCRYVASVNQALADDCIAIFHVIVSVSVGEITKMY